MLRHVLLFIALLSNATSVLAQNVDQGTGTDHSTTLLPAVSEIDRLWDIVKDSRDVAVLDAFIRRYENSTYAKLALARIATLKAEAERDVLLLREEERRRADAEAKERETTREREAAATRQSAPQQPVPQVNPAVVFDGHWYSSEWKYGYRLRGGVGIASSTNSPRFNVGDVIVRIRAVGPQSFNGEQMYRDGKWYKIRGELRADGRIHISGEKNVTWFMTRIE